MFFVLCLSQQPRYLRMSSPLRASLPSRSEHEVIVQVSLAKSSFLSEFLDLFLIKFVGGELALPLRDG